MILDPKKLVELGVITNYSNLDEQLQPNSFDLTVKRIQVIEGCDGLGKPELEDAQTIDESVFSIWAGKAHYVVFNEIVKIPQNVCGLVIPRSSANRVGIRIDSALYDSGFNDYIGATIYPWVDVKIEVNQRIATMIFMDAAGDRLYKGQWQQHILKTGGKK